MQATLLFTFPGAVGDVALRMFIPFPEQRPRTSANFLFMCTGSIPPDDVFRVLRLQPGKDVELEDLAEARKAGLRPFRETAVVRLEKGMLVEIGSSASRSIYKGGFVPDEPVVEPSGGGGGHAQNRSALASMRQYQAGTILCGNAGVADTHASRYYILLTDLSEAEKSEFRSFMLLGRVVEGLAEFKAACETVSIHPRTLAPLKKISLSACELEYEPSVAHFTEEEGGEGGDNSSSKGIRSSTRPQPSNMPRERVTGRVRQREEEGVDSNNALPGKEDDTADSNGRDTQRYFFRFGEIFPSKKGTPMSGKSLGGPATKRHRTEVITSHDNGEYALQTTATGVCPSSSHSQGSQEPFDFFKVQENAFMNDIAVINETQRARHQSRERRLMKKNNGVATANTNTTQRRGKAKHVKKRY